MSKIKKLFEPIKVGNVELPNRILLLAHGSHMARDSYVTEQVINYYMERVRGGAGVIMVDATPNDISEAKLKPAERRDPPGGHLGLWHDDQIPGMRKLVNAIHEGGTTAAIQIELHPLWTAEKGGRLEGLGASDEPAAPNFAQLRAATKEEIRQIIEEHAEAARRAREAGFDLVQFMAGIGYFVSRFLSSRSNKRTDEYGGDIENRIRILLEIIDRAKQKAGNDYTFTCRLSADEFMEGGNTIEDTKKIAPILEKAGFAAFDIEQGRHDSPRPLVQQWVAPGTYVYLAEELKKVVNVPVTTAYRMIDPLLAEDIIAKGRADLIGMVRALIADPEFPNKAREGRLNDIRRCIGCCRCLDNSIKNYPLVCSINASIGKELEPLKPAKESKKVMVIGAGPSGMEAARIAALRGHKVTLFEKSRRLGGLLVLAAVMNKELPPLLGWMRRQISNLPIEVRKQKEVTPALVKTINPDVVILAAGGTPLTVKLPGINGNNVLSSHDFLDLINGIPVKKGILLRLVSPFARYFVTPSIMRSLLGLNFPIKKRVAIIGGQFAGCEVALALVEKGKEVTIIEESNRIGADIGIVSRWVVMKMLKEAGARLLSKTKVTEITDKGVRVIQNGSSELITTDTVLITVGNVLEANTKLVKEFQGKTPVVYPIGDCASPGKIMEAVASGYEIGSKV